MTPVSAAPSYRGRPFSVHSLYNVFGCKGTENFVLSESHFVTFL